MPFAVKFQAKAHEGRGIPEGEPFVVEEFGWGPTAGADGLRSKDLATFATRKQAEKFIKGWGGHPWWVVPNGNYEIVEVRPRFVKVQEGWEEVK